MEIVRRQVKFDYFRVVSRKDNDPPHYQDTLFDLRRWINKALKLSLGERVFDYRQERARLEKAGYDYEFEHWYLHFVRMRDSILPSLARITESVEPFELDDDEYLGEEVTALYHEDDHILMLQRNRYSLGPSGVEEYLNLVWKQEDNETIYLRPIKAKDALERAKSGHVYRRIQLRFADLDRIQNLPDTRSPIKRLVEAFKEKYGAINAEIVITMGSNRKASLDPRTVIDSIDDVVSNTGYIRKAQISVKNDDTAVEVIDLFEEKVQSAKYFEFPKRTILAHETIFAAMVELYKENRSRLLSCLQR